MAFTTKILKGTGYTQIPQAKKHDFIKIQVIEGIGNLHTMKVLSIQVNQLTGSIPITIFNISRIEVIALTSNSLSGYLPNGLCNGLPILKGIYLSTKKRFAVICLQAYQIVHKFRFFFLSENEFDGPIHSEIGRLSNMQILALRTNHFTGEIPKEISNLVELKKLGLSDNSFSCWLDMEIFNISGLRIIDLSLNNLSGSLPPNMCSILPNIEDLYLGNLTNLVGTIPHSISNCSKLTVLDLSGSFPNCLGNITSLREIHLGSNKFSSNIPPSLGNLRDVVALDLSSNDMVGTLPPKIGNLKAVTKMDLSMNQFSTEIRREIGGLQNLAYLSLRHNKFQGAIPDSMSNMVGLQFLDLSHNNISGIIPMSLEKLQYLKYFNVSDNQYPQGSFQQSIVSFGSVYKGVLRSRTAIAVKVFTLQLEAAYKSFDMECEVLRSLRHWNLIKYMVAHLSDFGMKRLLGESLMNLRVTLA
ncbi:hypothetical protein P3S68_003390 [Capsicum galapagoense]